MQFHALHTDLVRRFGDTHALPRFPRRTLAVAVAGLGLRMLTPRKHEDHARARTEPLNVYVRAVLAITGDLALSNTLLSFFRPDPHADAGAMGVRVREGAGAQADGIGTVAQASSVIVG